MTVKSGNEWCHTKLRQLLLLLLLCVSSVVDLLLYKCVMKSQLEVRCLLSDVFAVVVAAAAAACH